VGGVQIRRRRSSFSHLVAALEADGHDVVAMSRSTGVDVVTGDGLAEALSAVECVIDVATGPSPDKEAATEFFTAASRNLHQAGEFEEWHRQPVMTTPAVSRPVSP